MKRRGESGREFSCGADGKERSRHWTFEWCNLRGRSLIFGVGDAVEVCVVGHALVVCDHSYESTGNEDLKGEEEEKD